VVGDPVRLSILRANEDKRVICSILRGKATVGPDRKRFLGKQPPGKCFGKKQF
jgi:hypothetical protein